MTHFLFPAPLRRLALALALASGLAVLAGCGGTDQRDPYNPAAMHVFGDELALLEADGRRHGMNGVTTVTNADGSTTATFACNLLPLWAQSLASGFGLVSDRCPGTFTTFSASYHAVAGAKVADLAAQVAAQDGVLATNDLVALHVGLNDIVEIYDTLVAGQADHASAMSAALAEARRRGTVVAGQVRSLIGRGLKVALLTPPDLGYSPWARALGTTAMDDISRISQSLSLGIRVDVGQLDARDVVVSVGTDIVLSYVNASSVNVTAAACPSTAALTACQSDALVSGATTTNYFWAGDKVPGWLFHSAAGSDVLRLAIHF